MIKISNDFLNDLYLSFEYFGAGPGCGGIAALWTKRSTHGWLLVMDGDITEDESNNVIEMKILADSGWRDVCAALIRNNAYAFYTDGDTSGEFAWPFKIHSKKSYSLGQMLITWAWAGPPLSSIVESLYQIDDEKIMSLLDAFGELDTPKKMENLIHKFNTLQENEVFISDLLEKIAISEISMKTLRRVFLAVARKKRAEAFSNALARSKILAPFRGEIEQLMTTWLERQKGSGWAFAMGRGQRAVALKAFIEEFILNNGVMPKGSHLIRTINYSINFDDYHDALKS